MSASSTITEGFSLNYCQTVAADCVHFTANKGAELLKSKTSYFADYKIEVITYNIKEGLFIAATVVSLACVIHILYFAASLNTLLLLSSSFLVRKMAERSMNGEEEKGTAKEAAPEKPTLESKQTIILNTAVEEDYNTINIGEEDDYATTVLKSNECDEIKFEIAKETIETTTATIVTRKKITSATEAGTIDSMISYLFGNFIDNDAVIVHWTSFFNKA